MRTNHERDKVVRELYMGNASCEYIGDTVGVSRQYVQVIAARLKLPPRNRKDVYKSMREVYFI